MEQEDIEEYRKCHDATQKLLTLLFTVTPGPRLGIITSMMLLITVAETVDASKKDTLQSLKALWDVYDKQKSDMGTLQ